MKRMMAFAAAVAALSLVLGLSSLGLAQDEAPAAPKTEKASKAGKGQAGEKAFKALDVNGTGKVTREEFMADVQKRAAIRWAKLDPAGKGYVTKDEFMAARAKHKGKAKGTEQEPAEQ